MAYNLQKMLMSANWGAFDNLKYILWNKRVSTYIPNFKFLAKSKQVLDRVLVFSSPPQNEPLKRPLRLGLNSLHLFDECLLFALKILSNTLMGHRNNLKLN